MTEISTAPHCHPPPRASAALPLLSFIILFCAIGWPPPSLLVKPYASKTSRANTDTATQDGGNEDGGENFYGSDNAPAAPALGGGSNRAIVPPSTAAAGAASAGHANRRIPAGDYACSTPPFQAAPSSFSRSDQMAPVAAEFGANRLLGSGRPGSHFQTPSEVMAGVVGCQGGAAEPGNGSKLGNR